MAPSDHVDIEMIIRIAAAFEHGKDLHPDNPFESAPTEELEDMLGALLDGGAIPDTALALHRDGRPGHPEADRDHHMALAGMLQGLAIGYEYCALQRAET